MKILEGIRDGNNFRRIFLSDHQKMLLKFSDTNIIGSQRAKNDEKADKLFSTLQNCLYSDKTSTMLFSLGLIKNILSILC